MLHIMSVLLEPTVSFSRVNVLRSSPDRLVCSSLVSVELRYGTCPPDCPVPNAPMTSARADKDLLMWMVSFRRSLLVPAPDESSRSLPARSTVRESMGFSLCLMQTHPDSAWPRSSLGSKGSHP